MVRISDIQDNKVLWQGVPFCNIAAQEIPNYILEPNDILFARTGGTVLRYKFPLYRPLEYAIAELLACHN